jgi:multidrug efflux pump subunit AcrA (membrane-fusion protein)
MAAPSGHSSTTEGDGWRIVDGLLDELDRLVSTEIAEEEFYPKLFERLAPLGSTALAIWIADSPGALHAAWHSPGLESVNGEITSHAQQQAVRAAIEKQAAHWLGAMGPGRSIVAPWSFAAATGAGAVQVWFAKNVSPDAARGLLGFMATVSELVATFRLKCQQRQMHRRLDQRARIDAFTQHLHESLNLDDTAYRIASDGRALVGCDRVAVAVRRGRKYKVIAVSGAEYIHRRSESAGLLANLCGAVAATGQPFWHGGQAQELPPQLSRPLADYLDESPAIAMGIIPLVATQSGSVKSQAASEEGPSDDQARAVLAFEQYAAPFAPASRDVIEAILGHSRLALANAMQVESIPAHRFWMSISREGWLSRWTTRLAIALAIGAAIVISLLVIPAEVRIKARGELQPAARFEVFAPRDGVVTSIEVDHGQSVQAGEVLLEMRSPELDLELQRVSGELETTRKRLAATQSERLQITPGEADSRLKERRLTAEEEQLQKQVEGLEQRRTMLREQLQQLSLRSPVAGDVITWNVHQRLATRPLRRGDALLTVADVDGPWQIELRIPSRSAGRLLAAQRRGKAEPDVAFVLATDPGRTLQGKMKHIAERVEIDSSGESYLRATVEIPREKIAHLTPGATVLARISCGRGSLGEAWFHDLWDAIRLALPF